LRPRTARSPHGGVSRRVASGLALAALLAACGGTAVFDGEPPGEGGAGGTGGHATTTTTTSAGTTTTTTTHGGGQGGGQLDITLSNVSVGINCMPMVPTDPVQVSFTASYNNTSSAAASASIVGATLSLGGPPSTLDWTFQISPATVSAPGLSVVQGLHAKVADSGSGGGLPCNFCTSPSGLLEVEYLVNGQYSLTAIGSGPVGCAM
jgi:hypothetical protein